MAKAVGTGRESAMPEEIAEGEVHIWWACLDGPERTVNGRGDLLSTDEQARARAFHFKRDRDRFVAARSTLRAILAAYTDASPASLRFRYGEYGKPYLMYPAGTSCHFSLAHSHERAVY
ncbi:MAG TPA: hypothetical protein VF221_14890, partial [Chloroflexota bacterium]